WIQHPRSGGGGRSQRPYLPCTDLLFIVQGQHSGRAQDRFPQPARAEQQKQDSDYNLQTAQGNRAKARSQNNDKNAQDNSASQRAQQGGTPTACDAYRQNDSQGFYEFDERSQERRQYRRCAMSPVHG